MKKTFILILFALLAFGQMTWAQDQTLTLNDGTNLRDEVPIRGWMDREGLGSQFIIPASELTAMQGGTINQLTFYAETASYSFYGAEYKVYITEVDYTEFEPEVFHSISDIESASYCDWNTMADYYSGGVSISNNMMVITLTAPYHYTGGNLLIGLRLTQEGSNGDNVNWYGRNQSTVSSVYPLYLGSNEFYFSAQYLPKVTFGYTPSSSAPTCMWPIVNSATVTNHTATISWTENGEATAWQVCLNDDESNILDASTNSYTFTGLDIETTYTAKVRSVCGGENHSPWSNKVTFTTTEACAPPTNLTAIDLTPPHATVTWDSYGESFRLQVSAIGGGSSKDWPSDNTHYYGFEENTISPWTQIDADGDGIMWEINSNTKYYGSHMIPESGHTGYKMVISGGGNGQGLTYWPKNYLVSPRIMLGGYISFWARQYYNHGIEAFKVMVSTTGNTSASDFTAIASYELDDRDWGYYTVDLSAYDGQMGYVAFYDYDHGISDALLLIDDITIVEGSNYIDCATNSYTMDVEPNTEYVMRVRTSCGIPDGFSEWSDFYSFTTTDVVPVYEINSEEDWNAFAYAVDHGYTYTGETVSLNTDLNGITTMVGAKTVDNSYKYFKGTFNGNGHTLNVNYDGSGDWAAPFSSIENATIKNLHVTGSITTTGMRPAGIVGFVSGTSKISNCWSEVALTSSHNDDIDAGGFVARVNKNKSITLTGCLFTGSITYSNANGYEGGGMVGWTQEGASATLTDCVFAPSAINITKYVTSSDDKKHRMFVGGKERGDLTNCYHNGVAAASSMVAEDDTHRVYDFTVELPVIMQLLGIAQPYNVSGITLYDDGSHGLKFDNMFHAVSGSSLSLELGVEPGYTASSTYYANGNVLTPNTGYYSGSYGLTMPAQNVTITAPGATLVTVYRQIDGYGESTESDHWAFIASPVEGSIEPTEVSGLIADPATDYDLYRLNPTNTIWENYKEHEGNAAPNFTLKNGRGYLYASKETTTLVFTGDFNTDATKTIADLPAGFNLVGNPFIVDAYVSKPYYTLDENGSAILSTTSTAAIAPFHGVIVQVDGSETVTFNTSGEFSAGPNNGSLKIALSQANTRSNAVMDNAIVSFNEGVELGKFYFGTQNANIYIPQGGEEYAIAYSEGQGEMPLNFKATENGTYTLSINPEGVEMAYLHLVDNLTGNDIDLLAGASTGSATYTFTAKTTDYESRFKLVFASIFEDADGDSGTFAFFSNGNWIIANDGQATLQVIDINGRILTNETVNGSVSKAINAAPGVYVIRLINGDNVKTQKIVIE